MLVLRNDAIEGHDAHVRAGVLATPLLMPEPGTIALLVVVLDALTVERCRPRERQWLTRAVSY